VRTITKLAGIAVAAGIVLGGSVTAAVAMTASPAAAPPPGTTLNTTYACVDGPAFEYYEFNTPLPHACHYSGQSRVALPTITLAEGATFPIEVGPDVATCTVEEIGSALGISCTTPAPPS